jgi:hypothetical protein
MDAIEVQIGEAVLGPAEEDPEADGPHIEGERPVEVGDIEFGRELGSAEHTATLPPHSCMIKDVIMRDMPAPPISKITRLVVKSSDRARRSPCN